jgi:hypothetical protein
MRPRIRSVRRISALITLAAHRHPRSKVSSASRVGRQKGHDDGFWAQGLHSAKHRRWVGRHQGWRSAPHGARRNAQERCCESDAAFAQSGRRGPCPWIERQDRPLKPWRWLNQVARRSRSSSRRDPRCLRPLRGYASRVGERLVRANEVLVGEVQRDCRDVILELLSEAVGQPREPAHAYQHREVLALDVAGADPRWVGVAALDVDVGAAAPSRRRHRPLRNGVGDSCPK